MKRDINYEKKTRPLEFLRLKTLSPKPHIHSELEMVLCFKGSVNAYINGVCHQLKTNQAIIVFPHQMHFYDVSEEGDYALFVFYPDITPTLKEIFSSKLPQSPTFNIGSEELSTVEKLTTAKYSTEYFSALLTGQINVLLSHALPKLQLCSTTSDKSVADEIIRYCADNFRKEITLQQLSTSLSISVSGISHIFNRVTGLSIPHYINWLRVSYACRLLTESDENITDIAGDVGFNTLRNFNRVFLTMMNQTPTEYREANKLKCTG